MSVATVKQCAILLDRGGTDGQSAAVPEALRPVGGRPFLAWVLRELTRYGVTEFHLLGGDLSDAAERAVADIQVALPRKATITLSGGSAFGGSGGAVFRERDRLEDRFLLCRGDSLMDTNLSRLLAGGPNRMLLRHQPRDARYRTVRLDGDAVTGFAADGDSGVVDAGMYLFDRTLFHRLRAECSLEDDVLPALAAAGALYGTIGEGCFHDISVAGDCIAAQAENPGLLRRKALFLDRDGVLNIDHGYVGSRDRFEWTDGALEAVRMATDAGWHVFIVTNQSGVARGYFTEYDVRALLDWIGDQARAAGGTIDDVRFCPYHPQAAVESYRQAHPWRKPEPGMLLDLIAAWDLDPLRCLMVGDQETDMRAAAAAGVRGHLFPGGSLADFVRPLLRGIA